MEEKVSSATTTVDFTAAPLKEHYTICLLGYWCFFFHSKVPGIQNTVSLLLVCSSPHSNAFVHSRATDVCRSRLYFCVGMSTFSHLFPCHTCMKLATRPPLCFLFIWLHCLYFQEDVEKSHSEMKLFVLLLCCSEIWTYSAQSWYLWSRFFICFDEWMHF